MIMSESFAIELENVSKAYKLYGGQRDHFVDALGLNRFGLRLHHPVKKFMALDNISLQVPHGQRIGLIGRNGAGKTTMLKLIGGNFLPTKGRVNVTGKLQALMSAGLGFHPEFTGRENVYASLQYNDLTQEQFNEAVEAVIRFCELGEFLDQPFKSYSLGMQSRLQFACATAINPDILIVDEVLGAGDVYFSVKSSARMERLTKSGATLILVSHSMQQILQFCERVIWVEGGRILRDGKAMEVVTEYEKFMFDLSQSVRPSSQSGQSSSLSAAIGDCETHEIESASQDIDIFDGAETIPDWHCQQLSAEMSGDSESGDAFISEGVSRWVNDERLKIVGARLVGADGKRSERFVSRQPFAAEITLEATQAGDYDCWYVVLIYGEDGKSLARQVSAKQRFSLERGDRRRALMTYDELLLGEGEYHVSVAIYRVWNPDERTGVNWYEILNRSLRFKVYREGPFDPSLIYHPHKWLYSGAESNLRGKGK